MRRASHDGKPAFNAAPSVAERDAGLLHLRDQLGVVGGVLRLAEAPAVDGEHRSLVLAIAARLELAAREPGPLGDPLLGEVAGELVGPDAGSGGDRARVHAGS